MVTPLTIAEVHVRAERQAGVFVVTATHLPTGLVGSGADRDRLVAKRQAYEALCDRVNAAGSEA